MIRRQVADEFFLITQTDHAHVAGQIAAHFGNPAFTQPCPRDEVLVAVAEHDGGWPIHDAEPVRNDRGLPLDVFETPRPLALRIWAASAGQAEESLNPYSALLVSLHNLALSVYATSPGHGRQEKFDTSQMTERFEVNKFQHREVERQEHLRRRVGLSTERPLKFGLAEPGESGDEDQLLFDFRFLQAMDLLSLGLCCTAPPTDRTMDLHPRAGEPAIRLAMRREPGSTTLLVRPWPFSFEYVDVRVPFKRVPGRPYASDDELRAVYGAAAHETLTARIAALG